MKHKHFLCTDVWIYPQGNHGTELVFLFNSCLSLSGKDELILMQRVTQKTSKTSIHNLFTVATVHITDEINLTIINLTIQFVLIET